VKLTRRQLVGGAGAAALSAAGIYELVDCLGSAPVRLIPAGALPPEQHVLHGVRQVIQEGVEVLVPPLHHQIVTATLVLDPGAKPLQEAQAELENALQKLESRYEVTPAGLGVTVAWGQPYFRRYVGRLAATYLPMDRRASAAKGKPVAALLDAIRFPSDPKETVLEANDVAVLIRSDTIEHIQDAAKELFEQLDIFKVASIRKGFAGGGFDGGQSLPKKMAVAAGLNGADLIPDNSELFLGSPRRRRRALGRSESRISRRSATRTAGAMATSAKGRRCTCRTSPRISRPGTSTSTSPSAPRRPSDPA
jgi:hypothetical protein